MLTSMIILLGSTASNMALEQQLSTYILIYRGKEGVSAKEFFEDALEDQ